MVKQVFDVAILGGGAAGSAAALTLLQAKGCSVCIIEHSDFNEPRIGETIPPDTNLLLSELAVDKAFAEQGHLPCYGSHSLWGSNRLGHNDFLTSPYGHGWHLDRTRFDRMLLEQAVALGAKWINEDCVGVQCTGDDIDHVKTRNSTVKARHYIDATGRKAVLLRSLGIVHKFNDKQAVIWARFETTAGHLGKSTWLEAAPNGWWYAAEVPGNSAIVALGTDPRLAKAGGVYQIPGWAVALSGTQLIAPKLQSAKLVPGSFGITSSHSYIAERIAGENWLAVGDAASAFDPLSSAGIHKALLTGQLAARALVNENSQQYADRVRAEYQVYLGKRRDLYRSETRWPDRDFWTARHEATYYMADHSMRTPARAS